jgi:hypothetical protein
VNKIIINQMFFNPSHAPVEVVVPEFNDEARFLVVPPRESDRKRWMRDFKLCETCGGLGFVPISGTASQCPRCKGNKGRAFDDPEMRKSIMADIVKGWHDWKPDGENVLPYSDEHRDLVASECGAAFFAIRNAAESALTKVLDDEGKG